MYSQGAIVRIKLENFLTYDSVEFRPGPKLNVIIGPNGSGKSTIVCGICLGLGGQPKLLDRASKPTDYIKHGTTKAGIEIELFNEGKNYIVTRLIKKDAMNSVWKINDDVATQGAVEELMKRLNIQIDNLCQFLPQDKVADFCKMSQVELLENTEKAVGKPEMFEAHTRLIRLRKRLRGIEGVHLQTIEQLEKEKALKARIEIDVNTYHQKNQLVEQVRLMKMKKPWVEYELSRELFIQAKKATAKAVAEREEKKREYEPYSDRIERCKRAIVAYETKLNRPAESINKLIAQCQQTIKNIYQQNDMSLEIQESLRQKRGIEDSRKRRYHDLMMQLESLKYEMSTIEEDTRNYQIELNELSAEIKQLTTKQLAIQDEKETCATDRVRIQNSLQGVDLEFYLLNDVKARRVDFLRTKNHDAYEAIVWLREKHGLFRGTVHEPIMTLINVSNQANARYIEAVIPYRDMCAFVCENGDDMELLLKELREKQRLKINVVLAPEEDANSFVPSIPLQDLKKYGFHHYLNEMFTVTEKVMAYLCRQYHVHDIPVGDGRVKDCIEELAQKNLPVFFTDIEQITVKYSRYSTEPSMTIRELEKGRILSGSVNTEKIARLESVLTDYRNQLRSKEERLETLIKEERAAIKAVEEKRMEKTQVIRDRDHKKSLELMIEQKETSIRRCESEALDLTAEEGNARKQIEEVILNKCSLLKELVTTSTKIDNLQKLSLKISLKLIYSQKLLRKCREESEQLESALLALQNEVQDLREEQVKLKDSAMKRLAEARQKSDMKPNDPLPDHLKELFAQFPRELGELECKIHSIETQIDCLLENEEVIQEYEARNNEIERLEETVGNRQIEVDGLQREVSELREEWLPELEGLVTKISSNFSRFFASMECAGEVTLNKGTDEDEYDKYGICIKVKFRDSEPLHELTPGYQSGGERSVSTVLYMMALQEMTQVPFRCVDEINQGMDPVNERRVFDLMVQTSCRENTAQYILLTPKLLPDLTYNEHMTILCVYNGEQNLYHTNWNYAKFIQRRKRLSN